nr:unnamed protein product [Digitaria exilis]
MPWPRLMSASPAMALLCGNPSNTPGVGSWRPRKPSQASVARRGGRGGGGSREGGRHSRCPSVPRRPGPFVSPAVIDDDDAVAAQLSPLLWPINFIL